MSEKKIRIGVVGVGHLGEIHVRNLKNITLDTPFVEFSGIFDVNLARANEIGERYKVKVFPTYHDLLQNVDAVVCVVPTQFHYQVGKEALERGKHLFLEKPMAKTYEEAEEILDLSKKKGLILQIGHVERFNPAFTAVAKYIERPLFAEIHRLSIFNPRGVDVDVILDLMIHDIDIVLLFFKEEPVSIDAVGAPIITEKIDIANSRLVFSSGAMATLTASRVSFKKIRKARFFQINSYIAIDYLQKTVEMFRRHNDEILPYFPEIDTTVEPINLELRAFIDSLRELKQPPVTGEDGLRALKVALAISKKVNENLENYIRNHPEEFGITPG
ncbi:MAG: Gfo/Idh/MocA family oxidoreductase [candidate division WOR-3 bacterium]